jgi:hypothetical protein
MTEEEILNVLDNSNDGYYCSFVKLGYVYAHLIDSRLTVFSDANSRWAICVERLGYTPRAGAITLDIHYYGNCLQNLAFYNNQPTNYYSIGLIDDNNFNETVDGEYLKPGAEFWLTRGQKVFLSRTKQEYINAGVEYEPTGIRVEEMGRILVSQNRDLFRATNGELYKSIPADLAKILVLDEWFHKDFELQITPTLTGKQLQEAYAFNKNLTGAAGMTFDQFEQAFKQQSILSNAQNREMWENNRPSSYETWQQLAKVIVTHNPVHYKPTVKPNTHWANWPNSGSM